MRSPGNSDLPKRPSADPAWWCALGLWLLNDHALKGAGLLDPVITGKLSDVCGLWVLPAGLAALAKRYAHTRIPGYLPYVVVALYFSGLQLWPGLVTASEGVLASLGVPSKITPDPSDLVALLVLWPAWRRYSASGRAAAVAPTAPFRWAMVGYPIMLFATVATSRVDQPEGIQRTGRLFLYNQTGNTQQITIKQIRANADANCFSIQDNPANHLHDDLFDAVETATLAPQDILVLDARADTNLQSDAPSEKTACHAMIIGGPKLEPKLLFWNNQQFPLQRFTELPLEPTRDGIITIETAPEPGPFPFVYRHTGETKLEHPVRDTALDPPSPECAPPSPPINIEWGEPFPQGIHRLESVGPGEDGCIALELASQEDSEQTTRRYLCIPAERFPFDQGNLLQFRSLEGENAAIGNNIEGWQIKGWKVSASGEDPDLEFYVILGQGVPSLTGLSFGTRPQDCPYAPNQVGCQTLSRPLDLMAKLTSTGQEALLKSKGDQSEQTLSDNSGEWTLELLQCEHRSVFDGDCSGPRVRTGTELQLLATWRPNTQ